MICVNFAEAAPYLAIGTNSLHCARTRTLEQRREFLGKKWGDKVRAFLL